MTRSGLFVTAASDEIGMDDVFDARIAPAGSSSIGLAEDLALHLGVLDDRLDQEIRGDQVLHRAHPRKHLVRVRPTFLRELRQALPHRLEAVLDGPGQRVVERDPPAGRGDDLRDSAAHLPRPDHEHVLEPSVPGHRRSLRPGSTGKIGACALPETAKRPEEHEPEDDDSDTHLDHATARLTACSEEHPGVDETARRRIPGTSGQLREQEAGSGSYDGRREVAVRPLWHPHEDGAIGSADVLAVHFALHTLGDLKQHESNGLRGRPVGIGDASHLSHHCRVGGVEPVPDRLVRTHARVRVGGCDARKHRDDDNERQSRAETCGS